MKRYIVFLFSVILSVLPALSQSKNYLDNAWKFAREYNYEMAEKNYTMHRNLTGQRDYALEAKLIIKFTKLPDGNFSFNDNIVISFKPGSSTQLASKLDEAMLNEAVQTVKEIKQISGIKKKLNGVTVEAFVDRSSGTVASNEKIAQGRAAYVNGKFELPGNMKITGNVEAKNMVRISLLIAPVNGGSDNITPPDSGNQSGSSLVDVRQYVDLGLSVLWATCNLGANRPQDFGNFYSWGDLEPKSNYMQNNTATYGRSMKEISGQAQYDPATRSKGADWRMPTQREMEELQDNTTAEWTTLEGVKGLRLTSKINGNSIFLPACGYRNGRARKPGGTDGGYWSGSPSDEDYYAYCLLVLPDGLGSNNYERHAGFCIRPVVVNRTIPM